MRGRALTSVQVPLMPGVLTPTGGKFEGLSDVSVQAGAAVVRLTAGRKVKLGAAGCIAS